jgi:hypothetical protein
MGKFRKPSFQILGIILSPVALFWVLYRHSFYAILDSIAVGILVGVGFIFGLKYLFQKKIFKFG